MIENSNMFAPDGPREVEQSDIDRALDEYQTAQSEGRLCAPDAYDLLFREGYLNTDGDGR